MADADRQRRFQGSLVTQAWSSGKPLDESNQFTATICQPITTSTA